MKEIALGLFILTYVLLLSFPAKRWLIALVSAVVFVVIGILPFNELPNAIDFNVLMMIGFALAHHKASSYLLMTYYHVIAQA